MNLTLCDIAGILGQACDPDLDSVVTGVSTDSRLLRPGMVFFALRGGRSDGHAFVGDAFASGAAAAVIETPAAVETAGRALRLFRVPDTLAALQTLASAYRGSFTFPVVAVTGSNGKTTTKDMIAAVLAARFRCAKTEGNLNNHIGVPLSVCAWDRSREVAVLEMGANHPGEIRSLCAIARPTHGVITNIGRAHLEGFGDEKGVLAAKSELLEALAADGTAFLNGDDPLLDSVRGVAASTVRFGFGDGCDVTGRPLRPDASGMAGVEVDGRKYRIGLPGLHNLSNALAAVAVGLAFGVDPEAVQDALARFSAPAGRTEIREAAGVRVIHDAYNANPSSVEQAAAMLKSMSVLERRAVVLGDMLELGDRSGDEHRRIGARIAEIRPNAFFCTGEAMRAAAEAAREAGMRNVFHFETKPELVAALADWAREGDGILIKGSRGMRMEEVVDGLLGALRPAPRE
jgi:UDP-N-acetylmuramoyl-tripeptide--D-alanyl-D-alanine ligase